MVITGSGCTASHRHPLLGRRAEEKGRKAKVAGWRGVWQGRAAVLTDGLHLISTLLASVSQQRFTPATLRRGGGPHAGLRLSHGAGLTPQSPEANTHLHGPHQVGHLALFSSRGVSDPLDGATSSAWSPTPRPLLGCSST
eukprot:GGOE01045519.1.p2 GENE.GGOE01045519.1~~GGOE01045519.1.p2  ORF type:complete len:140 (-),score=1.03 GGOE01045519.1:122-541(-)